MSKESTGKRITDELRTGGIYRSTSNRRYFTEEELTAIADRIDAEHEAKVSYWQGACYKDGYDEGFASADDWLAQHEDAMAEHGWVRMPEDADGEYWFRGDKIMLPDGTVVEIVGIGGDWLYYCVASVAMTVFGRIRAHDKRHYKQPTVEDMLREFYVLAVRGKEAHAEDVDGDVLAQYAAKLQLRKEA